VVTVTVPGAERPVRPPRESIQIQSLLAAVGERMGFSVWIPRGDRQAVLRNWRPQPGTLLESLPLGYEPATMKTIEQIDVLWVRHRTIMRAFEIEHSTPVFSGISRLADLMALQPNLAVKLHIVAPMRRRDKVFQQMTRPAFSFYEKGPFTACCTFLAYDVLRVLSKERHLADLRDSVLDKIAEAATE
jgi:hypothetical protein